jgi:MauM/NapG family ferredoxin protein
LEPILFQYAILTGLFFLIIVLLNLLATRFWCRYLCPLGALLGILSKAALIKRRVNNNCGSCHLCEMNCPTGTIDPLHDFASDPGECILCMNCLQSCQKGSLSFSPRFNLAPRNQYDPGRRTFMNSLVASVIFTAVLSIDWLKLSVRNFRLRPPGVIESDFSTRCIRCGLCLKVCPTGGLHVDIDQSEIESAGTPILVPRMGFCQFSCNACGQICPVEAIPPLALEIKQSTVIGKAYIDHDRCIAWGDHQTCVVCEEMCPLPQKAITLESGTFSTGDRSITIPLPVVNRDTCIGCGICENKCPVVGESAIRVHVA